MSQPRKYDMTKQEDVKRWFKEMKGYLTLQGSPFIHQGTDMSGRLHALAAFYQLKHKNLIINKERIREAMKDVCFATVADRKKMEDILFK